MEWQTVSVYAAIGVVALGTLLKWHTSDRFKDFTLLDLVAENGKLSSRKFMEFGAWVVSSVAFVVMAIRGGISPEFMAIYCSIPVVGRTAGQVVNTLGGRKSDDREPELPTVEDEQRHVAKTFERRLMPAQAAR